jgi:HSP20 family protein
MTMERWRPRRGTTPWRPFRDLDELQRRFEDFWPLWPSLRGFQFETGKWVPAVDMYEQDDKYVVKAELPGMKEEDVDVSISGDRLTIKGEKKAETEVKEENYYRSERSYGSFFRSIDLPSDADPNKIDASYDDGVLEITIPKTEAIKPKRIEVSAKKKGKSSK